jgi:phage shock protein PspC (stress-responsive transcriptional regulator)
MPDDTTEPERPPDPEAPERPSPAAGAGPSPAPGGGYSGAGPQYPPPAGYPPAARGGGDGYPGPRHLARRMDDRVFAGVASGLGAYFNIDPVLFRVGFVALTLAGGVGVLVYLLCWAILPPVYGQQGTPAAPGGAAGPPRQGQAIVPAALQQGGWRTYLAAGAVLFAVVLLFSPFTRPVVVFALLLIALGVLLMAQDQPRGSAPPGQPGSGGAEPPGAVPPAAAGDYQAGQWEPSATGTMAPPAGQAPPAEHGPSTAGTQPGSAGPYETRTSATAGDQPAGWAQPAGWGQPAAYQAAPAERGDWGSTATAVRQPQRRRPRSVAGWVTVALALLAGGLAGALDNFGVVNMTPSRTLALMLTVLGVGLLATSLWGRAGWLILVGFLLLPAVVATSVLSDLPVAGETGRRTEQPLTLAELRPQYQLAAGNLTIDLSQVAFPRQSETTVGARVSAGELRVLVPAGKPVTVHADVGAGNIQTFGHERGGFQVHFDDSVGRSEQLSTLVLNLRVGVGSIRVDRGP